MNASAFNSVSKPTIERLHKLLPRLWDVNIMQYYRCSFAQHTNLIYKIKRAQPNKKWKLCRYDLSHIFQERDLKNQKDKSIRVDLSHICKLFISLITNKEWKFKTTILKLQNIIIYLNTFKPEQYINALRLQHLNI